MKMMGLDDYARDTTPFFADNDFYEIEIGRRIDLFGNIAHVWSAYEARNRARTTRRPSGAGSTRSSCSAIPSAAGGSWR